MTHAGPARKYAQVAGRITALIEAGTLPSGRRIPSVRAMADQMGLSVMTVLEGYRRLEDRGVIESRPRSGYYVRPELLRRPPAAPPLPEPALLPIPLAAPALRAPDPATAILAAAARSELLPLGAGVPDPSLLPGAALSVRLARAVRAAPETALRYAGGAGLAALREALAVRMLDAGCTVGPDDLVVTVGATEGLLVALGAVARPGDTVLVESPGYAGFHAALARLHLRSVEVPADPATGLSLPHLTRALARRGRARAVLLCPTNSNPTGATMPDDAKAELADLARRAGVVVIEDDTFGEVTFAERRARAVKSLAPADVVYVGSLSKILAPGYRVGWVAAGRAHAAVLAAHAATVLAVPSPTQMAVAAFLGDGGLAHHLRRLRRACAETTALVRRVIARAFPAGTRLTNPRGGPFLWLELPRGCDAEALAAAAPGHGFSLAPGTWFSARRHYRRFLRLNAALPFGPAVEAALATLAALVARQRAGAGRARHPDARPRT